MDLDEMRGRFIKLLAASYESRPRAAARSRGDSILLNSRILKDGGLLTETFWGVVCPRLEKEGVLTGYSNPGDAKSDARRAWENDPLATARDVDFSRAGESYERFLESYEHAFAVDGKRLREAARRIEAVAEREGQPIDDKASSLSMGQGKMEPRLRSIHLVVRSLGNPDPIYIVLDGHYESRIPVSGSTKAVRLLFNLNYPAQGAPDKRVPYTERNADAVNNDLFKIALVKDYMDTNELDKPTLATKANDTLIPTGNPPVHVITVGSVPSLHQHRYLDKAR